MNMNKSNIEFSADLIKRKDNTVSTISESVTDATTKNKKHSSVYFNKMADVLNNSEFRPGAEPVGCDYYVDVTYDYCGVPTDYLDGKGIVPECLAMIHLIQVDKEGNKSNVYSSLPVSAVTIESHDRIVNTLMFQALFWYEGVSVYKRPEIIAACRQIQRLLYVWKGYNNPTDNPLVEDDHESYFTYSENAFNYNEIKRNQWYTMSFGQEVQEVPYEFHHHGYSVQLKRQLVREKGPQVATTIPPIDASAASSLEEVIHAFHKTNTVVKRATYFIDTRWTFVKKTTLSEGYSTEEKYLISERTAIDDKPMGTNQALALFEELYMK